MSDTSTRDQTHRALVFTSPSAPASVSSLPNPQLELGAALVRPLVSPILPYSNQIYANGNSRGYTYPLPFVPGASAVARLVSAPADAPTLRSKPEGSLCWINPFISSRDNGGATRILMGINGGSPLMDDAWRNGTWADIAKVPVENVHLINESRLLGKPENGGLGYSLVDLANIGSLAVPYGGLCNVDLRPGEVVVIAPATGNYGGGAVHVALAMGASKVVAMGRNQDVLKSLEAVAPGRVTGVTMSGDAETDRRSIVAAADGPVDVFFDISPSMAANSSHFEAGIMALRPHGRIALMGGVIGPKAIPYHITMLNSLIIKGQFMYTPRQADELLRLIESGLLKIGSAAAMQCVGIFGLEQWEDAFETAEREAGAGKFAVFGTNGFAQR